jgi:multicomponent Na+:H+ antiporter subunit D
VVLAIALAALGLYRERLPAAARRIASRVASPPLNRLKLLHDGVVGEYVTWLTVGAAAVGAFLALLINA